MDHTYTTIRVPVVASVKEVISAVADKLGSGEGLIIVKMSSGGGTHCKAERGEVIYPRQLELRMLVWMSAWSSFHINP